MGSHRPTEFKASEILCQVETFMLGRGAFGVVVLGKHPVKGPVAVKCFDQDENITSFFDDLRVLHKLSHEHIAQLHGFTRWEDPLGFSSLGLVMHYYKGGSLEKLLQNQNIEIHASIRLRMALQISKALAFLHNFSSTEYFVHNDVKPENVLLTSDFNCKLNDFGTCSMLRKHQRTLASIKGYTVRFSAPEVLAIPYMPPHESQDVYSFAMLLFVLLARELPFGMLFDPFAIIEGGRPKCEVIETFKQSLPDDEAAIISLLQSVMKRCWTGSPTERPSMLQVRDELQELYDQQNPDLVLIKESQLLKQTHCDVELDEGQTVDLEHFCNRTSSFVVGVEVMPRIQAHYNPFIALIQENHNLRIA